MESAPATPLKRALSVPLLGAAGLLLLLASCGKPGALRVERILKVGAMPEALRLSPDGAVLAVACARSNDVWIFRLAGGEALRVDTGLQPADLLFSAEGGRLLVSESGADSVAQISLAQKRVTRRFKVLPEPARLESFGSDRILVTSLSLPGAGVFRGPGMRPEKTLALEGFVERILPSRDGKQLYAVTRENGAFVSIRAADLYPQLSVLVGGSPVDLALDPGGAFAWVAGEGKFFDYEEEEAEPEPGALTCVRLLDGRAVDSAPLCAGARAMAISPSGRYLHVLCGEESEMQVFDSASLAMLARVTLHGDPTALAVSPDGRRVFVAQRDLKQVSVVRMGSLR